MVIWCAPDRQYIVQPKSVLKVIADFEAPPEFFGDGFSPSLYAICQVDDDGAIFEDKDWSFQENYWGVQRACLSLNPRGQVPQPVLDRIARNFVYLIGSELSKEPENLELSENATYRLETYLEDKGLNKREVIQEKVDEDRRIGRFNRAINSWIIILICVAGALDYSTGIYRDLADSLLE